MLFPILILCLVTYVNGKICDSNQFWSYMLERCENCSKCVHPDIAVRPCEGHSDTVCRPLSVLNIDWSSLTKNSGRTLGHVKHGNLHKEMLDTFKENFDQIQQHEKHMREKQKYLKRKFSKGSSEESDEIESGDILIGDRYKFRKGGKNIWETIKLLNKHKSLEEKLLDDVTSANGKKGNSLVTDEPMLISKTREKLLESDFDDRSNMKLKESSEFLLKNRRKTKKENDIYDPHNLKFDKNGILVKNFEFTKLEDNVKMEKLIDTSGFSEEFTTTETSTVDWQSVILDIAVYSCIIFFLVAAIYSVRHAKHWKKLKNYIDADVEELQAWLSSKNSERKIPASGIYKATTEVVHKDGTQCKYLERIIRMNGRDKFNVVMSNVYEKDNKRPSEMKPLAKKCPL